MSENEMENTEERFGSEYAELRKKIDKAEKRRKWLLYSMLTALCGIIFAVLLPSLAGNQPGDPPLTLKLLMFILFPLSAAAILSIPILIGATARSIGKSGILWGGLSILTSPIGYIVAYIKLGGAIDDAYDDLSDLRRFQ